jgi:acyl-CoA synthetase (AMP-forming)/AMP-acid ligase II
MTTSPFVALATRVRSHAAAAPGRRAVVCDGATLTYGALVDRALDLAERIRELGLEPGGDAKVGIIASNSVDFAVVVLACQRLGVAAVPLPTLLLPDALARMIDDAGATVVFHDAQHADRVHAAARLTTAIDRLVLVAMTAGEPRRSGEPDEPIPDRLEPDWTSDLIYSSGTTGIPKGIVQSYRARTAQNTGLTTLGLTTESHLLQTVSLYSNFGLAALSLTLWAGGTLFLLRKFSGAAVVELLANEPIDHAWFAPATLVRTLEAPGFEAAVRGKSATKLCAGAPLGVAPKQLVRTAWLGPFFDLYGQTETGTLTLLPVHAAPESKLGSVGTVVPTASVRILDEEGCVLPPDHEGEIAGHSTTLMAGYYGRHDATAAAWWQDELGRRYVRTGDVGRLDPDGYLWLCDRKKDMIISGGYNVYPADIERVLQGHPAVFEVAVIGYPSAKWGETPVAFVVLRPGATTTTDELRAWVNARVAKIQRVAAVTIVGDLPNGTMGKILKRELRERYRGTIGELA